MKDARKTLNNAWDAADKSFKAKPAGQTVEACPDLPPYVEIPPECKYLRKKELVTSTRAETDRIRKTPTIGPEKEIKHKFEGDTKESDAISQIVTIDGREIEVIRPKGDPPPGKRYHSVDQIANALGTVPPKQLDKIHTLVINNQDNPEDAYWAKEYKQPGFHSFATGGADGVTFYPDKSDDPENAQEEYDRAMIHEGGHAYAASIWKDAKVKKEWADAIKADRRSPSKYADAAIAEDFAESLVMYSLSKGTPCEATAKLLFPARYAALDKLLQ